MLAIVLMLNSVRGGERGSSEPIDQLVLSREPQWVVLSLDVEDNSDVRSYRATLENAKGNVVWVADLAGFASSGPLTISGPSTLFQAGDYVLTLAGRARNDRSISRAYSFRVQLVR